MVIENAFDNKEKTLQLLLSLLLQGVLRNSLEGLFHVDSFFSGSLKVWNIAFRLAPSHSTFLCDLKHNEQRSIVEPKTNSPVSCPLPRQSYCLGQQMESSRDHEGWLG